MDDLDALKKQSKAVDPAATAETLVETLSETAESIRFLAEVLLKEKAGKQEIADDLVKMSKNVDDCARIAAIANMQREELEKNLAEQKLLVAQLGEYFKRMEIRSGTLDTTGAAGDRGEEKQ